MHELPLLITITLALIVAFLGGVLARRIGLPTMVGYLLAGIVIGPFTPGYVGDVETIQQLAELGVIFLMFGVGLHFSFQDLWRVRDLAIPGALLQTFFATLLGFGLSQLWGWTVPAGIVFGLSISVASTVVLLRGLEDHSLLNTSHGQVAVGWLVMEDILSVFILVLMPSLAPSSAGFDWLNLLLTLLKAAAFAVVMILAGSRLIPWLLDHIAHTRSRELFILAILAITLGVAMGASELFGVSLALGAFVAGAIISQSHLSHQVGADILPFREAFASLFFVSVGMLVNPAFLWNHLGQVAALTLLIVLGKSLITLLLGLIFPRPAMTFLVVAVGLSQIGEFSFILGQSGVALNLLNSNQYSLLLAGSLLSITLNPFMYRLLPALEKALRRLPIFWRRLDLHAPLPPIEEDRLDQHVVVTGYGRMGSHLVDVLDMLHIPALVIESDPEKIEALNQKKVGCLYGDAANSEIITHAGLERARALVVTVPEEASAAMIVSAARRQNSELPIVARAASEEGVQHLARLGANAIIFPEREGGLEMVLHTLLMLGFPLRQVYEYVEAVRRDQYNTAIQTDDEYRILRGLVTASDQIEITWVYLTETSPLVGQTILDANIRSRTGASIVAILREHRLIPNPKSMTALEAGDRLGIIGEPDQIEVVRQIAALE